MHGQPMDGAAVFVWNQNEVPILNLECYKVDKDAVWVISPLMLSTKST